VPAGCALLPVINTRNERRFLFDIESKEGRYYLKKKQELAEDLHLKKQHESQAAAVAQMNSFYEKAQQTSAASAVTSTTTTTTTINSSSSSSSSATSSSSMESNQQVANAQQLLSCCSGSIVAQSAGHHIGHFLPKDESNFTRKLIAQYTGEPASSSGTTAISTTATTEVEISASSKGHKLMAKMGWTKGMTSYQQLVVAGTACIIDH
jgi:hypothetical protein